MSNYINCTRCNGQGKLWYQGRIVECCGCIRFMLDDPGRRPGQVLSGKYADYPDLLTYIEEHRSPHGIWADQHKRWGSTP